ncbi:MAG: HD domain-containing protein [Gammaproteobacteria bacterium]|nr:HD domain-containing protein [Gammaproteobacteria bacterium]
MAYLNMVVRLGMEPEAHVFAVPILLAVVISIVLSSLNLVYYIKLKQSEKDKLQELEDTQLEVIMTLTEVAESRCNETGAHIKRVSEYSRLLAQLYGLSEEEVKHVTHSSPLHDIGKIGIADAILLKPDRLTVEEYEEMKNHADMGYRVLADSTKNILKSGAVIAQQHHEKWDGSGYPNGLKGEKIHIFGRIVAIADVFDALASERAYKPAWKTEKIIELFKNEKGKHFDPELMDLFLDNFSRFESIRLQYQ